MATGGLSRGAGQNPKPKTLGKLQRNFNREGVESVVTKYFPHLWDVWNQSLKYCVLNLGYTALIQGFFFFFFFNQKERTR